MYSKVLIAALFVAVIALASAQSSTVAPANPTAVPVTGSSGAPPTGGPVANTTIAAASTVNSTASVEVTTITVGTSTKSAHGVTAFLSLVPIAISMLI